VSETESEIGGCPRPALSARGPARLGRRRRVGRPRAGRDRPSQGGELHLKRRERRAIDRAERSGDGPLQALDVGAQLRQIGCPAPRGVAFSLDIAVFCLAGSASRTGRASRPPRRPGQRRTITAHLPPDKVHFLMETPTWDHGRSPGRGNVALALLANTLATGAVLVAIIPRFGLISGAPGPRQRALDAELSITPWVLDCIVAKI